MIPRSLLWYKLIKSGRPIQGLTFQVANKETCTVKRKPV